MGASSSAPAAHAQGEPMLVNRVHLESVDSTNRYARENAATFAPEAVTVVTAAEQTAGRGRMGRQWVSSGADDIKATFAFRVPPSSMASAYQLSPLLALVARRALAQYDVEAQVKWPNDIILSGCKKAGGILCELESVGADYWAALGIGLNVNSLPDGLGVDRPIWPLTTLRAEAGGKQYNVAGLTDTLVDEFARALPIFLSSGFAPFQSEYEAASVLLGRRVRFLDGERATEGTVTAIGADGKLYIKEDGASEPRGFLSGEVSRLELAPGGEVVEGASDGK